MKAHPNGPYWRLQAFATVLAVVAPPAAVAGDLVYTPRNPNFGGNPFNGSTLLQSAQAQNQFPTDPNAASPTAASSRQSFGDQITSALLAQVAQNIGNTILGPNAQQSGTFTIGSTVINFGRAGDQVNISLSDSTGTTNISVPVPRF